ncbi:MAG TPA: DUF6600 domain-containing protein, partial [Dissulfurispiraceae bacterium]|nr:DUF6600 domain-containing protein [Dissulfurispiraceae bacterium]
EPWGWAPYHYGRWAYVARFGWCWVPPATGAVYWGPGYVGWVRTNDYIAWVPLAPGETYYGRGYYGPHSVNIVNVAVRRDVPHAYQNITVVNGATVVYHNTFGTTVPRQAQFNHDTIRRHVFTGNNLVIGAPAIQPHRSAFVSSDLSVPAQKMPPKNVQALSPQNIKRSRPFIREQDRSAFHPGFTPKTLPVSKSDTPQQRHESSARQQSSAVRPTVRPQESEQRNNQLYSSGGHETRIERKREPQPERINAMNQKGFTDPRNDHGSAAGPGRPGPRMEAAKNSEHLNNNASHQLNTIAVAAPPTRPQSAPERVITAAPVDTNRTTREVKKGGTRDRATPEVIRERQLSDKQTVRGEQERQIGPNNRSPEKRESGRGKAPAAQAENVKPKAREIHAQNVGQQRVDRNDKKEREKKEHPRKEERGG